MWPITVMDGLAVLLLATESDRLSGTPTHKKASPRHANARAHGTKKGTFPYADPSYLWSQSGVEGEGFERTGTGGESATRSLLGSGDDRNRRRLVARGCCGRRDRRRPSVARGQDSPGGAARSGGPRASVSCSRSASVPLTKKSPRLHRENREPHLSLLHTWRACSLGRR